MKVFVTGGAGYIGSITTELLLDQGYDVTVFDNLERGHRTAIDERAEFIQGDLRDSEQITEAIASVLPDTIMHFAAYALVGESMEDPMLYFRNNVDGGINLVHAMQKSGVSKIIFSSTCATYGKPNKIPISEDNPQVPANPYGESKLMFEKILTWCRECCNIQPVFLRYFNAAGASEKLGEDHDPETHLIPIVLKTALEQRDKVLIFGDDYNTPDGTCIRDYIHIVDLAQAHILAMNSDGAGAFNLGNGSGYSVKEVIEVSREVTGHPIPAKVAQRRQGDPPSLIASAEKAKKILGWKPKYPELCTIIEHAWNWHNAYPKGYSQ